MPDRLQEIRARLDAAHDALWSSSQNTRQDAPHAVHLIADIAWLLDEVERLRNTNASSANPLCDEPAKQGVTKRERPDAK